MHQLHCIVSHRSITEGYSSEKTYHEFFFIKLFFHQKKKSLLPVSIRVRLIFALPMGITTVSQGVMKKRDLSLPLLARDHRPPCTVLL
jgi:hypothetical protein